MEAPRFRARLRLRGLTILTASALLAGCAHRGAPPPLPPRPAPGYVRRVDSLAVGPQALAGLRIALDPGHGGVFRGVVGLHGLAEAEVNLRVALALRDLLAAHGATVFLTRDSDRDFLTPADSALRVDLAERSRLANAFGPDLFVSIHHNAEPAGRRDVNETQTYYKLGDDGPSLDAAIDIHRSLKRNIGIAKDKVVPGNYFVLRTSEAPAVLTETSHLSDPDVEALLADSARQRLEAEALFLGIARWFSRPRPVIAALVATRADGRVDSVFEAPEEPRLEARIAGEFDEATLAIDGTAARPAREGAALRWRPTTPLVAGAHEVVLGVRLAGAGAAAPRRLRFTVRRPVERLRAAAEEALVPGTLQRMSVLRIEALDGSGRPSPDSLLVRVRRILGRGYEPAETLVTARDGIAWAYLRGVPAPTVRRRRGAAPASATPRATARFRIEPAFPRGGTPAAPPVEIALAAAAPAAPGLGAGAQSLPFACIALRMPEAVPLVDAPGTREPTPELSWLHRDGFARVTLDTTGHANAPPPPGFRLWPAENPLPPRFVAIAGGALIGRRITLDPEGGADDPAGAGPGGTRAAVINLECARILSGLLRTAGAEVALTRRGDLALSDVERVQISEASRPDRLLRIGHRAEPPRLGYYFSSSGGKRWAEHLDAEQGRAGLRPPAAAEDAQYVLQQSSCVALYASPARIDRDEIRLLAPGRLRAEAYALFLSLAREWSSDSTWAADSLEVRDGADRPAAGVPVRLGGLLLETDEQGRVRFARTEPGPLEVEIAAGATVRRRVLLDSEHGVVLTGPLDR